MVMNKTFCIFSAHYLPNVGGVEKYTHNLALALAKKGNNVIIVTSNVFNLSGTERLNERIEIMRLPCYSLLKGRLPISKRNAQYREMFRRLETMPIDYVVVNTRFYRHSFEGVRLAETKGARPIVVDHGSAHLTLGNAALDKAVEVYEHAVTKSLKLHDIDFYAVSRASSDWLRHFGIDSLGVLNNSIDSVSFRASASGRDFRKELGIGKSTTVISFVGRLIPEKGIESLVGAAGLLSDENVVFLLAGDGPMKAMVEGCGLANVRMMGRLEAPEIADLLISSDAFCLPTRSEGFSTALLECAACGTPPIVTHVGGVDELMPSGDGGFLLNSADPDEIARNVRLLISDRDLARRKGESLRIRVESDFSWERTAEKVILACERANGEASFR